MSLKVSNHAKNGSFFVERSADQSAFSGSFLVAPDSPIGHLIFVVARNTKLTIYTFMSILILLGIEKS